LVNIILQHFDGELRPLDKLSMANMQEYAEMVGAEYRLITGKPFNRRLTAPCQKVHMISKEFDKYDDVLMVDIDMFAPIGMTTNVFEEQGVGMYHTVQKMLHKKLVQQYPLIASSRSPYWGGAIYKMNKKLRVALREANTFPNTWMDNFNLPYHFEDEGIFHVLALRAGINWRKTHLDPKWCQCSFLPNPEKAGFIHIRTKITPQGPKRYKMDNYQQLVDEGVL
jgi:hypothetical protein